MATGISKDGRAKPKTTSTISWVSDKLAAGAARVNGGEFQVEPLSTLLIANVAPPQDVEIAVLKATNHDITPPKEKHVRTLREIIATSPNRKKVIYIVHMLYERLVAPNESWLVVLKALMTIHKLLKADGDATFKQEMTRYKEKRKLTEIMRLNNFADKTQKECWDFSAFVRVYSSYLEERLSVFEAIKFDVDRDGGGDNTRFKKATGQELLDELPRVQKMLQRILVCIPEGAAAESEVVMESMRALLTECFRLYRVISEGVINLAQQFFEMDRIDASKGLEMYKESINSATQMQSFFSAIQSLSIGRQIQFPQLTSPPEDFLEQMEEYVRGATGRTTTRKFPSTISRNAHGAPSAALATPSDSATGSPRVVVLEKTTEEEKTAEPDLLGLDALDFTPPTPAAAPAAAPVAEAPVVADPFGDTVFQAVEAPKEGAFMDDWGQTAQATSPEAVSSVAAEQNASPFDDFFGGGPMVQPPPAPEAPAPAPAAYIQPPPQYTPPMQGYGAPAPVMADNGFQGLARVSSNPFGGYEAVPQQQPVHVAPAHMPSYQQTTFHAPMPGAGGTFSGPGAFADPFEGLTPTIQKKSSFALPGAPMRQEPMGSNPFGPTPAQTQPRTSTQQQDFGSLF